MRDVMTPRAEIFAIDRSASRRATIAAEIAQSGYSRVPVYRRLARRRSSAWCTRSTCFKRRRRAHGAAAPGRRRAGDDAPCNELLFRMLRGQFASRHRAATKSGAPLGLVTLEDLLEELVGDIRDEHDEPEPRPTP